MLSSQLCKAEALTSPAFVAWADRMRPGWDGSGVGPPVIIHRKLWEWLFITEALSERGMLAPGRRGLGFGVGQEPLVSLFASLGAEIVATDMDPAEAETAGWTATGVEYAGGLAGLNLHGLCDPVEFTERVSFRVADMNDIASDLTGFDFTWSSCAFEHLGSIAMGQRFISEQMRCLRPGGVAVHTTEYNVASNDATVDDNGTVLFRRRDMEELVATLTGLGHHVELDLTEGETPADRHVDAPPFTDVHLRLQMGEFVTTSFGLIVVKGDRPDPPRDVPRAPEEPAPARDRSTGAVARSVAVKGARRLLRRVRGARPQSSS